MGNDRKFKSFDKSVLKKIIYDDKISNFQLLKEIYKFLENYRNMSKFIYKDIVQYIRLLFAMRNKPRGWIYQQENEPKHTSRHVTDWCPK
jgi:hypothetical protein